MSKQLSLSPEGWEVLYHNLGELSLYYLEDAAICIMVQRNWETQGYSGNIPDAPTYSLSKRVENQVHGMPEYQLVDLVYQEIRRHLLGSDCGKYAHMDEDGLYQVELGE